MRLLYDATPLLMRSAGVKNYHYSLLERLLKLAPARQVDVRLFPYLSGLTSNHNERSNYSFPATAARLGAILGSNYLALPIAAPAAARADLFHITHHLMRPPSGSPLTTMVHDPTPLTMPECHTDSNIRYFERFVEKVLPRLEAVITPSEAVKRELIESLGVPAAKITAIHHGVDPDFFEATPAQRQVLREEHDLPEDFVLFLGSMEPRKNLVRLAQAFDMLPTAVQARYPLVIAGAGGWKNDEIRTNLRRNPHIHGIGYVRRELLPALYASCSLFAFPTLYEGFGMPLLEAMAAGAPTLTANVSAMPEVAGDTAVLVDPLSVDEIAKGLLETLSDPNAAAALGDKARQRARRFTWERTAEQTLDFFARVAK